MSEPAPDIPERSDSRRNWKSINLNSASLREARAEVAQHRATLNQLRRGLDTNDTPHPFEVYLTPNTQRVDDDPDWWRKFFVRHGYVTAGDGRVTTEGCDDADDEGVTPVEIEVPVDKVKYKIWIEVALDGDGAATSAELNHGETGWAGFPAQDGMPDTYFALIAEVSTDDPEFDVPNVRQFIRADYTVPSGGSGGDSRWS